MVAAAKLRRAQTAAEAARPYAERMESVLANLAGGVVGGPQLLAGNGRDDTHLSGRRHRGARIVRRL